MDVVFSWVLLALKNQNKFEMFTIRFELLRHISFLQYDSRKFKIEHTVIQLKIDQNDVSQIGILLIDLQDYQGSLILMMEY